jgi:hypothetical protein
MGQTGITVKDSWFNKSACGSEGHVLAHHGKVPITVAGDQLALSRADTTLSKGVCGDDPPTMQDIELPRSSVGQDPCDVSLPPRHQMGAHDRGASLRPRLQSGFCCGGALLRPGQLMGANDRGALLRPRLQSGFCCGGVLLRPRQLMGACCGGGVSLQPRHPMGACCGRVSLWARLQSGVRSGGVSLRPRHPMGACVRIRSSRALRILSRGERIVGWPGEAGTGSSVSVPV